MLFETCIEECPDDELALAPVSTLDVGGCTGCDACRDNIAKLVELGEEAIDDDFAPCVIDDDMQEIYELIDSADEITVVSPVYFAGPPSQLKALLDRLQPYYWTNARVEEKRPAVLHVVGEGGDRPLGACCCGVPSGNRVRLGGEDRRERRDHGRC